MPQAGQKKMGGGNPPSSSCRQFRLPSYEYLLLAHVGGVEIRVDERIPGYREQQPAALIDRETGQYPLGIGWDIAAGGLISLCVHKRTGRIDSDGVWNQNPWNIGVRTWLH